MKGEWWMKRESSLSVMLSNSRGTARHLEAVGTARHMEHGQWVGSYGGAASGKRRAWGVATCSISQSVATVHLLYVVSERAAASQTER